MKTKLVSLTLAAVCLALLCETPVNVRAATITVTSANDGGPGSLRQALASAANGDTIDATGVSGTIILTSGQLNVPNSVTILGPGPAMLTVSGNNASRVFETTGTHVTISGLTIANGHGATVDGAGIRADGSPGTVVTISDCVVANNSSLGNFGGGGIFSISGVTMTITNCTISGNSANGWGGGIYNYHGVLKVVDSTFSGNSAWDGGGLYNDGSSGGNATLTINASTFSGNSASAGGGIFNDGSSGGNATLTINASTVSGNSADNDGGGLCNDGSATLTINVSTFSDNSADFNGGGLFNNGNDGSAILTINASTFSDNSAKYNGGGGICNGGFSGSATLRINASTFSGNLAAYGDGIDNARGTLEIGDTILNAGASGVNIWNESGTVTSDGYNLSSDDGGGFLTATNDQINTDPKLGPLQDNGGPTWTHALVAGSPAIDKGKTNAVPGLARSTDQRGLPRPVILPGYTNAPGGDGSDIGAFEFQQNEPTNVTTLADSGPGSLRQLIGNAAGGAVIVITNTGTITLTSGELWINKDLSIVGPGAASLAISGGFTRRAFNIASNIRVSISNLTIRDCRASDGAWGSGPGGAGQPGGYGGGIYNAGQLTLSECVLTNNRAGNGGTGSTGIMRGQDGGVGGYGGYGGDGGSGGGIYNASPGLLRLDRCTISGNFSGIGGPGGLGGRGGDSEGAPSAGGLGGPGGSGGLGAGLFNDGIATLNRCTVSANRNGAGDVGGNGGAGGDNIAVYIFPIGYVHLHWGGNGGAGDVGGAGGSGGGVCGQGQTTLDNCTISGNQNGQGAAGGQGGNGGDSHGAGVDLGHVGAGGSGGDGGSGGGICNGGTLELLSCTIVYNTTGHGGTGGAQGPVGSSGGGPGVPGAAGQGGGVRSSTQLPSVLNTILAENINANSAPDDVSGDFNSQGHNLVRTASGSSGFGASDDLLNMLPDLGPLADNAGPTSTHLPFSKSPVINAGCNRRAPETDQRGLPRIVGGTIDIGACEFQSPQSLISYAWLQHYDLPMNGSADRLDADGDGQNNWQEWQADTSPKDANDFLHITSFARSGTYNTLWWTSKSTRLYLVERRAALDASSPWETIFTNAVPGWNNVGFDSTGPQYFYRIRVVQP